MSAGQYWAESRITGQNHGEPISIQRGRGTTTARLNFDGRERGSAVNGRPYLGEGQETTLCYTKRSLNTHAGEWVRENKPVLLAKKSPTDLDTAGASSSPVMSEGGWTHSTCTQNHRVSRTTKMEHCFASSGTLDWTRGMRE